MLQMMLVRYRAVEGLAWGKFLWSFISLWIFKDFVTIYLFKLGTCNRHLYTVVLNLDDGIKVFNFSTFWER